MCVFVTYICPSSEHYIQFGGWVNETHAYLLWLNRPQNKRIFALYDFSGSQLEPLHPVREVIEQSTAWIEVSNVSYMDVCCVRTFVYLMCILGMCVCMHLLEHLCASILCVLHISHLSMCVYTICGLYVVIIIIIVL